MDYSPLSMDEFNEIVKPVKNPTRTFYCGLNYLETWLQSEKENCKYGVDLNPEFQRGHVWTEQQQVHYLENVFRGIVDEAGLTIRFNCPTWRNDIAEDSDLIDQMVCVDGLQSLNSFRKFIAGEIEVFGIAYKRLPRRILLRSINIIIKMFDFQYYKDLLQYYVDINGGGTVHTEEELERVRKLLEKVSM